MNLEPFVRNIVNRLTTIGVNRSEIYSQEIIDELNNVIPTIQLDDIRTGNDEFYGTKVELPVGLDSIDSPTLFESPLNPIPFPELPTQRAILRAFCFITPNKLKRVDSYNEGDYARIGGTLYRCVESFENLETRDLTFKTNKVRSIYTNSTHKDGEVVFNPTDGSHYRANKSMYEGQVPEEWVKLYWKEVGSSGIEPNYVTFDDLRTSQLMSYVFSVYQGTLYTTPDIGEIHLWYIPEPATIQEPDDTIKLTANGLMRAREMVTQNLRQKLQVPQPEPTDE